MSRTRAVSPSFMPDLSEPIVAPPTGAPHAPTVPPSMMSMPEDLGHLDYASDEPPPPRHAALDLAIRYGVAVLGVCLAVALKIILIPHMGQDAPSLIFFGTVMGIAWFGGFGPGALATVLAAIASNYFFTDPFYKFHFYDPAERWRSVLFMGEGLFISILCDKLMRARRRAEASEQAARRLERRILEVTEAEQGRIGRDLHDGLGQHLTGVAFLS